MRIVNVRGLPPNSPGIVYCGRACNGWTGSVLANPFRIGRDGDRAAVIQKYRLWLWDMLRASWTDDGYQVLHALQQLTDDSVLGCWCWSGSEEELPPIGQEVCHCQTIIRAARWLQNREVPA